MDRPPWPAETLESEQPHPDHHKTAQVPNTLPAALTMFSRNPISTVSKRKVSSHAMNLCLENAAVNQPQLLKQPENSLNRISPEFIFMHKAAAEFPSI
jgi:hypothetical protein